MPVRKLPAAAMALLLVAVATPVRRVAAEPTPGAAPRSFMIVAAGDILPEAPVRVSAAVAGRKVERRYDFRPIFSPMAPIVEAADLAICHMEIPVGLPGQRPGNHGKTPFRFNRLLAPYELAADVAASGFDRCSTASNHSYDLGDAGIASTLGALDAAGLSHTGTARTADEAAPELLVVNGVTVAHLSYTNQWNTPKPADAWRVNAGTVAQVTGDVAAARAAGAEVVIVSLHMGDEVTYRPNAAQRAWAEAVTAAGGIDLILMHHTHTQQPVEMVNGTWVFWGLGNFVSGMGPGYSRKYSTLRTLDGLLARVRFTESAEHPGDFLVEPEALATCNVTGSRYVYPASATLARTDISKSLRRWVTKCLARTRTIVPNAA